MKRIYASEAMLPAGWRRDVVIEIDDGGDIAAVKPDQRAGNAEPAGGPVIPGIADLHSHAFQRAMAGLAERLGSPEDSFWTWREVMYAFLRQLGPDDVQAIAAQLYCEKLKHGYTGVAEFHYLHHAPDGRPYAERAELSLRHLLAAQHTGIAITLLPSLYAFSNFGDEPLKPQQKRFATDVETVLRMAATLRDRAAGNADIRVGVAPHSLRAVNPAMLKDLLDGITALDATAPVHIHLAEQIKEVNDCLAWADRRPVEWMLANAPLDARWCLVHCTHVSQSEAERLASSEAVVGLCPATEANLGDGVFPFARFKEKGGRYGIGGASHLVPSPIEELRWLEYLQRLALRRRNIAASPQSPSTGATLWRQAAAGAAQALGRRMGAIAPGNRADLVVLNTDDIRLCCLEGDTLMDAFVFVSDARAVKHVMVGGKWVVRDGHHPDEEAIAARYRATIARLQRVL